MIGLVEKTVKVWRAPTSPRSYRSKRAAFDRWAKDLILGQCGCDNGDTHGFREAPAPYTCPMHAGPLFNAPAWACSNCGAPDSDVGWPCSASDGCGGRHTVPTTLPNSVGYQKLKRRLSRWLQWATTKATS